MNEKSGWFRIDNAILALVFTGFAYSVAYQYEHGYMGYFGVPFALVEVTLNSLITSVVALVALASLTYVVHLFTIYFIGDALKAKVPLFVSIMILIAALIASFTLIFHITSGIWGVASGLFLALLGMLGPLVALKTGATYKERLEFEDTRFRTALRNNPLSRMPHWEITLAAPFIFASAQLVALELGRTEARTQNEFLITETSPPCVLMRVYGETLVCAQYSGTTLVGRFQVLPKLDAYREWTLKRIDKLDPVQDEGKPRH